MESHPNYLTSQLLIPLTSLLLMLKTALDVTFFFFPFFFFWGGGRKGGFFRGKNRFIVKRDYSNRPCLIRPNCVLSFYQSSRDLRSICWVNSVIPCSLLEATCVYSGVLTPPVILSSERFFFSCCWHSLGLRSNCGRFRVLVLASVVLLFSHSLGMVVRQL